MEGGTASWVSVRLPDYGGGGGGLAASRLLIPPGDRRGAPLGWRGGDAHSELPGSRLVITDQ